MFITAKVVQHPEDPDCTHVEDVSLIVIDPRPGVPKHERCRLALDALFARDERIKRGHYSTITLAPLRTPNLGEMEMLLRGVTPPAPWLVLTPDEVLGILAQE